MATGARVRAALIWAVIAGFLVLALATWFAPRQAALSPTARPPVAVPAPAPVPAQPSADQTAVAKPAAPSPFGEAIVKQLGGEQFEAAAKGIHTNPTPSGPDSQPAPAASAAHAPSPVDMALHNLVSGTVAFTAPAKMAVGKAGEVRVLLSARKQVQELLAQLGTAGQGGGGSILIADRMQATLSGDAFSISPAGPQVQAISKEADNTWQWAVSPKTAGDDVLVLRLDAVLKVDGTDTPRFLTTFEKHIAVDVGWPTDLHGWTTLARQTFDDAKWIITTLAALLAAAVGWFRKKSAA